LLIYFFKYDLGGENWNANYVLFNTFGGGIQIISMMIFYPVIRKFLSSIKVFYVSFAMAIAGYSILLIMMFCNVTSIYMLFIPGFFVFAAFGMLTVLTTVFLANTVDYGEWKNQRRDESVIFSMQTFVVKLASGVAAMIATICLTFSNINQDTSETMVDATIATATSGQNVAVLRMTMTIAPIIGLLIALFIFAKKYILTDEKLDEIKIKLQH
jgi:melibiose permease